MTTRARNSDLVSLRDRIASLRVVKCRMTHERVVGVHDPARPAAHLTTLSTFTRVGLCSPDERDERLGCSHTMSRVKLDAAISELEPEKAGQLRHELNWLTNEIHLLDHRKSNAEARLAAARHEAGREPTGAKAAKVVKESKEVKRLERQHDEYVERVGMLRNLVVLEIEKLLGEDGQ